MKIKSYPSILYFGTPVVLISSKNPNNSDNLAPASSIFWLGWRCVIGLGAGSQTSKNLLRTGQCVLNLPSADLVDSVNKLAKTTGRYPVPEAKIQKGYFFVENKFEHAGFSSEFSETVEPLRVKECAVQLEATVESSYSLAANDEIQKGIILIFELKINRVYLEKDILLNENPDRVDPDKWKPLIMSFQEFYTLGEKINYSTLAEIPETLYNTPDRAMAMKS